MNLSARPLFDNPGDAALFVPRAEATRVEANCREGINTLVLGDRGMGKTSLLRHVAFRLREAGEPSLVVDASQADDTLGIIRLIATELGRSLPEVARRLGGAPEPTVEEAGQLLNAIRALRAPDESASPDRTPILLDTPPAGAAAHTLFGRLRDELWQVPFVWVVAAPKSERGALLTPPADVFFEDVVELAPLTQEQQQELLAKRLDGEGTPWRTARSDEGNPRTLLEATRGALRGPAPPEAYFSALEQRRREVALLGRAAAMAYDELDSTGPASASDANVLHRLGWSRQRAAQVFTELQEAGFVRAEFRPGPNGRPRKTFEIVPVQPS